MMKDDEMTDKDEDQYVFAYYLDDEYDDTPSDSPLYVVMERVGADCSVGGAVVVFLCDREGGWIDRTLEFIRRRINGGFSSTELLKPSEAKEYAKMRGCNIELAKEVAVESYIKSTGYSPVLLDEMPDLEARIARAGHRFYGEVKHTIT